MTKPQISSWPVLVPGVGEPGIDFVQTPAMSYNFWLISSTAVANYKHGVIIIVNELLICISMHMSVHVTCTHSCMYMQKLARVSKYS